MKACTFVLAVFVLNASAFAADPSVPSFDGSPLDFVPTPLAQSTPSELLTLLGTPTPWREPAPQVMPPTQMTKTAHLQIVEPDPALHYAMPIVTPDPAIDYKLRIIGPSAPPATDGAK